MWKNAIFVQVRWKQAVQKTFLTLHTEAREVRRLLLPIATIALPWWPSQLSEQPLLHSVFESACLRGVVNKSQQISPWVTSEIIIMMIAPQKRHFPQDSTVASTSFPSNIALLLSPGWEQSSSSPWRRGFLPLCWCFNNLHSNIISKLASIVSSGLLCAMKLDSILCKSPVVCQQRWYVERKKKGTEITVALQPWMPYQLRNNRKRRG